MVWQGSWVFDEGRTEAEAQGLEARGVCGEGGPSRGPIERVCRGRWKWFWTALNATGQHPQDCLRRGAGWRTPRQGGAGRGEAGTDMQEPSWK